MNPKFKNNLLSLTLALGTVATGYALGQPPSLPQSGEAPAPHVLVMDQADVALESEEASRARAIRGAMRRHLAMPFVSIAALAPRQES